MTAASGSRARRWALRAALLAGATVLLVLLALGLGWLSELQFGYLSR